MNTWKLEYLTDSLILQIGLFQYDYLINLSWPITPSMKLTRAQLPAIPLIQVSGANARASGGPLQTQSIGCIKI
jgi:hypothetical protein